MCNNKAYAGAAAEHSLRILTRQMPDERKRQAMLHMSTAVSTSVAVVLISGRNWP